MMAETQTIWAAGAGGVTKMLTGTRIERRFNPKNVGVYTQRILNEKE
jgi:hypothetical protein